MNIDPMTGEKPIEYRCDCCDAREGIHPITMDGEPSLICTSCLRDVEESFQE